MYNPYSLKNKTILITGASSGIGRATAIECSRLGARLILTARNEKKIQETLSCLEGDGHNYFLCDLCDSMAIKDFVNKLPHLDGVVNNAGSAQTLPIPFIKESNLCDIFQINTIGPMLLLSLLVKNKKVTSGSSVVFTSSISALGTVSVGNTMYAASKGAVSAFVMGAAKELAEKRIRVNAVCPSMIETNFISHHVVATQELLEANRKIYPLKRYGNPEEVAWAIIYLLSDAAAFVTGTNLIIDGGRLLK